VVHLEERNAHDVDHDGGDEGKDAFPDLFGLRPEVDELGVELRVSGEQVDGGGEAGINAT
jgi:hypothetical protein